MSYIPGQDQEIIAVLQQIKDLIKSLIRHMEQITDNEDLDNE